MLAAASEDGYVWIWDAKTQQLKKSFKGFMQGAHSVAFSPDGRRLVAGGARDDAVRLWDTETWEPLLTLEGEGSQFKGLQFSSDNRHLLGANAVGLAHLWTAPSWEEIHEVERADRERASTRHAIRKDE
jgi:WD40 repeat protein